MFQKSFYLTLQFSETAPELLRSKKRRCQNNSKSGNQLFFLDRGDVGVVVGVVVVVVVVVGVVVVVVVSVGRRSRNVAESFLSRYFLFSFSFFLLFQDCLAHPGLKGPRLLIGRQNVKRAGAVDEGDQNLLLKKFFCALR